MLRGLSFGTNTNSLSKQKTSKSFLLFQRTISPKTSMNHCFFFAIGGGDPWKNRGALAALCLGCIIHMGVGGRGRGVGGLWAY